MSLEQLLVWIPPGSPDETLARQVNFEQLPAHVAVIMDGNGRWAAQRHLPRVEGHRAGVDAVRDVIETGARLGLEVLTLYAFSVENWKRPAAEVSTLMGLLKRYLGLELDTLLRNNIRFNVIGRVEALPPDVRTELLDAERKTSRNTGMIFNIALNYGGGPGDCYAGYGASPGAAYAGGQTNYGAPGYNAPANPAYAQYPQSQQTPAAATGTTWWKRQ